MAHTAGVTPPPAQPPASAAPRQRRTPLERIQIAQRVWEARENGIAWKDIAAEEGIPARTLQDIDRKHRAQVAALKDPEFVLDESVLVLQDAFECLYEEMENGDSSSARVGAARALMAATRDRLNLLASIGAVPGNVGAKTRYRDLGEKIDAVDRVLARHSDVIPDHVLFQINAAIKGLPGEDSEIQEVNPSWSMQEPKTRPY